jgi:hypothetical protein
MTFGRATAPSLIERRSAPRTPVTCPARLRTCFGDRVGVLSDLSISGARFQSEDPPKEGTTALLEWDGHDAICRVVWSRGSMCGILFERPIPRHVVERCAPSAVPAEPPAEVARIPHGRRSSLRAVLLRRDEE